MKTHISKIVLGAATFCALLISMQCYAANSNPAETTQTILLQLEQQYPQLNLTALGPKIMLAEQNLSSQQCGACETNYKGKPHVKGYMLAVHGHGICIPCV